MKRCDEVNIVEGLRFMLHVPASAAESAFSPGDDSWKKSTLYCRTAYCERVKSDWVDSDEDFKNKDLIKFDRHS